MNAADLAARYKARGMDRYRAWDQFVIDRALRPELDVAEFYRVYAGVGPHIPAAELQGLAPPPAEAPCYGLAEMLAEYRGFGRPVRVTSHINAEARTGRLHRTLVDQEGAPVYEVDFGDGGPHDRDVRRLSWDDRIEWL